MKKKLEELVMGFVLTAIVLLTTERFSEFTLSTIERLTIKFPMFIEGIIFFVLWVVSVCALVALMVLFCFWLIKVIEDSRETETR